MMLKLDNDVVAMHRELLVGLFPDERWLSSPRAQAHPAKKYLMMLDEAARSGGAIDVHSYGRELTSMMMDLMLLSGASGGENGPFSLGNFDGYGNQAARARVHNVIKDPQQFNSLLTEFAVWLWCKDRGHPAVPYTEDGLPDFRVDVTGAPMPYVIECKNFEKGTGHERIPKIVTKANDQIKRIPGPKYGIVFANVTQLLSSDFEFSDNTPEEVSHIAGIFRRSMIDKNTSVSCVVLFWDEHNIHSERSTQMHPGATFVRKSVRVLHRNAKNPLPPNSFIQYYGYTIMIGMAPALWFDAPRVRYGESPTRNSPCLCGSGLRLKDCHGKLA